MFLPVTLSIDNYGDVILHTIDVLCHKEIKLMETLHPLPWCQPFELLFKLTHVLPNKMATISQMPYEAPFTDVITYWQTCSWCLIVTYLIDNHEKIVSYVTF